MKFARSRWGALPVAVRAALLIAIGCMLFSIMGALVKLLGQRLDSLQIAFFRSLFGFFAILPFVLRKKGHHAFRTTHPYGHFLRGATGVAAMVAGFYATTRLPLTDSTAISFTAPLFMILTAIFLLGEKVRWRRGLATLAGFIGVLVMVRPDSGALDKAAMVGLFGAFLVALSTTLLKRLSTTEEALTILVYFSLFASVLTALPAYFVWHSINSDDLVMLALSRRARRDRPVLRRACLCHGRADGYHSDRLQPSRLRRDHGVSAVCRTARQIHAGRGDDYRRIDALHRLPRGAAVPFEPRRSRDTADRPAPGGAGAITRAAYGERATPGPARGSRAWLRRGQGRRGRRSLSGAIPSIACASLMSRSLSPPASCVERMTSTRL